MSTAPRAQAFRPGLRARRRLSPLRSIRWALWTRRSRTAIGVGGIADQRVPLVDWKLAGDGGGAAAVAILEDLQEVMTRRGVERFEPPVVEDEQIDTTERAQQTRVAAVAARQGEIGEQPRDALRDKAKVEQAAAADRVG
jgi:hypothetical protein